jgi:hypothetical protein
VLFVQAGQAAMRPTRLSPSRLRQLVYRSHPCLARIVDREDGRWDPTINYGGGHGDTSISYGLGQANPGTKMAPYGADWRTNPWTQLRWMRAYAGRYGGECGAWAFWQAHWWW